MKLKKNHRLGHASKHLSSETADHILTAIASLLARLCEGDLEAGSELELLSKRLDAMGARSREIQDAMGRKEITHDAAAKAMRDIVAQLRVAEIEAQTGNRLH